MKDKIYFYFFKNLFEFALKFKYRFQFLTDFIKIKKYLNAQTKNKLFWQIIKNPSQAEDWLNIKRFIFDLDDLVLIDIGANVGDFAYQFITYCNPKISYCYEPVKTTFKDLEKKLKNFNTELINKGVSNKNIKMKMKTGNDSTLSSVYAYNKNFTNSGGRELQKNEVEASFISIENDQICEGNIFLKIDVQGMDEDTLEGCNEILPRVKAALIESSLVEEFIDIRPSFAHICKKLLDYELYPICFQSYGTKASIYPYERDILFVKKDLLKRILD